MNISSKHAIPIFLASDENYSPYLAATLYSVLKNTKSEIEFYILDNQISDKSKKKIAKFLKSFDNFSIEYLDVQKFDLERFPNIKHYSITAFARYFIPELKPNLKKALYLDTDIIVKGDIKDLFNQDLEDYPIGSILEDFWTNYKNLKTGIYPNFKGGNKYFNSGVLLIDIRKWLENDYAKKMINLTIEYYDKLNCPDQDVFNIVFENNFKKLDYKFNYMPGLHNKLIALHPECKNSLPENAVIIHYTIKKPWLYPNSPMADDFWKIIFFSPFCMHCMQGLCLHGIKTLKEKIKKTRILMEIYK